METMNLNDAYDGMVSLNPPKETLQYNPDPPKAPEKNIHKQQTKMDSTPIADIMQDAPGMMMDSQDPRAQFMQAPAMPMIQQKPQAVAESKNPMNLSDEHMRALVAGVAAIIAFSKPVQDKLASSLPQFFAESGSNSGVFITGLIAAIVFYFAIRFLKK